MRDLRRGLAVDQEVEDPGEACFCPRPAAPLDAAARREHARSMELERGNYFKSLPRQGPDPTYT